MKENKATNIYVPLDFLFCKWMLFLNFHFLQYFQWNIFEANRHFPVPYDIGFCFLFRLHRSHSFPYVSGKSSFHASSSEWQLLSYIIYIILVQDVYLKNYIPKSNLLSLQWLKDSAAWWWEQRGVHSLHDSNTVERELNSTSNFFLWSEIMS